MMFGNRGLFSLFYCGVCLICHNADAQMSGNRATVLSTPSTMAELTVAAANSHISIEGTCQKRVTPTSIRLIWAVTAEDKDAATCRKLTRAKIEKTSAGLAAIRVGKEKIFEDFISAIPRFEWIAESRDDEEALVETQTGYRMQTNLHIAVETNEQAMNVVDVALASGLTDLIGVDYAADLEQAQNEARLGAMAAAKRKSEMLLSALFEVKPKAINLQEETLVRFPDDLYDSFENVAANNLTMRYDDRRHRIVAYRPKNTYYAGQLRAADDKSYALPMKPEIVVESNVVIYYQSPSNRVITNQRSD